VLPAGGLTSHGTRDRKYIRIVIVLVAAIVVLAVLAILVRGLPGISNNVGCAAPAPQFAPVWKL
jgi:hypothetical protein